MSIQINGLTKRFGEQVAVNKLSFTAKKGEITGFLGPNGAGKSTTMKMICGLIPADEGSVEVCGLRVEEDPGEVKKIIGYLPESNPLYLNLYVREFLLFMAKINGLQSAKKKVEEIIELTGLTKEANKKIRALSKGYRQRLGLAHALLHDPEVLILDEPTSGLDPNQLKEIRGIIKELGKDKAVLFSSHIMQEIQALCDHVVIINEGKLVANESMENLQNKWGGKQIITLGTSGLESADILRNIRGVDEVEVLTPQYYKLICDPGENMRKKIYDYSIRHKFAILEMSMKKSSMESIFQELTKS